jgi:hypothetical protein
MTKEFYETFNIVASIAMGCLMFIWAACFCWAIVKGDKIDDQKGRSARKQKKDL